MKLRSVRGTHDIFGEEIKKFNRISKVVSINRDKIVLQILKKTRELEKETDLWLIFSPIKLYRMNVTIQKATELGVSKIIPCITQNTNQTKSILINS